MPTTPNLADRAAGALVAAVACLAPWAFGAVEAWAGLGLAVLSLAIAALAFAGGRRPSLVSPGLALAVLAGLGTLQAATIGPGAVAALSPATAADRAELTPLKAETVAGLEAPPVAPPASTLSLDGESSRAVASSLALAWLLFAAASGATDPGERRRFALAVGANAAALALFAVVQALTWNGKIYWLRPSGQESRWFSGGPFVGHSHLAAYLNIGLGLSLGRLLGPGTGRRGDKLLYGYLAGLAGLGVVASQSRAGTLGMIAALGATLALARRGRLRAGAGLVATGAVAGALLLAMGVSSAIDRLGTVLDTAGSGYSLRFEIWGTAARSIRAHPLVGTGLGTFAAATGPLFRRDPGVTYYRAENEYVDLLTEAGLLGALVAAAGLLALGRVAWRALDVAEEPRDRALSLGATFGIVALAVQSLADFAPHIPAVGLTAAISAGYLCRPGRRPSTALNLSMIGLAAWLVYRSWAPALAEASMAASGLPMEGSAGLTSPRPAATAEDYGRTEAALRRALARRPGWAEGHLRLGESLLGRYEAEVNAMLDDAPSPLVVRRSMADPLYLHQAVHEGRIDRETAAAQEPVRDHLAPAALAYLTARSLDPWLPLAHARLASLDFLLRGGDAGEVHAARARRLAGGREPLLMLTATACAQAGDTLGAARCWRQVLVAGGNAWEAVADQAGAVLSPAEIVERVLPADGVDAIRFADRLYDAEGREADQRLLLQAGIDRLEPLRSPPPGERRVSAAERHYWLGHARAMLDERAEAARELERAATMRPDRVDWREELAYWQLSWGDLDGARRSARAGLRQQPGRPGLARALEEVAGRTARGERSTRPGASKAVE